MRLKSICSMGLACSFAALLSSCGGGGSDSIGNTIACAFQNCTNSATISVGDINAYYVVTQGGNDLHVAASLGQTANLLTTVQLSGGDSLAASVDNQSAGLGLAGGMFASYVADFADGNTQPVVTVDFNRSGTAYASTVTMPPQFSVLAPLPPTGVTRAMGSFTVDLGIANDKLLSATLNAQCARLDGTTFSGTGSLTYGGGNAVSGGTALTVDTATLDTDLNSIGQLINSAAPDKSLVANCDVQIVWMLTQNGQVSSSLYKNSRILGETSATQSLHYDAQRQ
jgi:hypothetical protein